MFCNQPEFQEPCHGFPHLINRGGARGISQLLEVTAQRAGVVNALHGFKSITRHAGAKFVDAALDLALTVQVVAAGMADPDAIRFCAL